MESVIHVFFEMFSKVAVEKKRLYMQEVTPKACWTATKC